MKNTKIQWCHSTVNPVMGCDGCELWPGSRAVASEIMEKLTVATGQSAEFFEKRVNHAVGNKPLSVLYDQRCLVAQEITQGYPNTLSTVVIDVIRSKAKCYAGLLGTMRRWHSGHAKQFEKPKIFPDRMAEAAAWSPPTAREIATKPWLAGLPRLIFISDMGDALSSSVAFEFLQ